MAAEGSDFRRMTEAELREWVEANPGRVIDRGKHQKTPLYAAIRIFESVPLIMWLLDGKGADVNGRAYHGKTPLLVARSLDILNALLVRGADPSLFCKTWSPFLEDVRSERIDCVERLLQDPRVRAAIEMRDYRGRAALHYACNAEWPFCLVQLLLQAGANADCTDNQGLKTSSLLGFYAHIIKAPLAQAPDGQKASILVKARRLVVASTSTGVVPSYLQHRVAEGQPLPHVSMTPQSVDRNDEDEKGLKFRILLAFLVGMGGGPDGKVMPAGVFRMVLDLLMPSWDPRRNRGIRGGCVGMAQQLQECEIVGGMKRVSLQPE